MGTRTGKLALTYNEQRDNKHAAVRRTYKHRATRMARRTSKAVAREWAA